MKRNDKNNKNRSNKGQPRKKNGGRPSRNYNIRVNDNANGWASLAGTSLVGKSMDETVRSEDLITGSKIGLVQAARDYNESAVTFPANIIAHKFGFTPWRFRCRKRQKNSGW